MTAWKRWQDFATMAFGVLLFISPFVFGETSHEVAARSAYVFGVLLVLAGALAAATRDGRRSLFLNAPGFVSVVTFVSPWVLRFSGVTRHRLDRLGGGNRDRAGRGQPAWHAAHPGEDRLRYGVQGRGGRMRAPSFLGAASLEGAIAMIDVTRSLRSDHRHGLRGRASEARLS
jgi:hypothetical protein